MTGRSTPGPWGTLVALRRLERGERQPWSSREADQLAGLRRAVERARRDVPVWRDLLPADVDVRSAQDLARLPVSDKALLRSRDPADLLSGPLHPGVRTLLTSGTSGEPFRVHYSPRGAWQQGLLMLRTSRARGLQPWMRGAATSLVPDQRRGRGVLGAVASRRRIALASSASDDELSRLLTRSRPASLAGHAHLLLELPHYEPARPLRVVATFGETLTPENRAALRHRFGVEPLDTYGTAEAGQVAWQCAEADLYHVNHETVVVEIVDDAGLPAAPGALGDVLLTTLWNPLMPVVRYRQGDAARWADRPCRCGSTSPALTSIQGRVLDWLVDDGGRRVAPQRLWLTGALGQETLGLIWRYRVTQSASGGVLVEIVAREELPADTWARTRAFYAQVLGAGTPVEVALVDELARDPSGKFEIFRSHLTRPGA